MAVQWKASVVFMEALAAALRFVAGLGALDLTLVRSRSF
jgi:hypothetical protein